ncbi:MAG TPA: DUF951 domain-containing protein [Anaerolineaceae bacterium]|nr:DUF951 domain-containing protein [Anaerolineaceae bacterium]
MLFDLEKGDIVRMRKTHPCGGSIWIVTRLGADIGLECLTCQRRIMLSRRELLKKMKENLGKVPPDDVR